MMTLAFDGFVYTMTHYFESNSYKVHRIELDRWNVLDEAAVPPITRGFVVVDLKRGKHTYWQLDDAEALVRGIAFLRGQDAQVWEMEEFIERCLGKGMFATREPINPEEVGAGVVFQ